VNLVISNCVINLSPEKHRVFAEIHRVLRTDGRFSISDIVAEPMPEWILAQDPLYSACISGAIREAEYVGGLRDAGFIDVRVSDRLTYDADQLAGLLGAAEGGSCCCGSGGLPRAAIRRVAHDLAGKVASVRVVGRKGETRH
jgi:SAM-dependent methyltransferase